MSYSIIDRAVFGPRHAKPRRGLKIAAKGSAIAALLAATGFAGAGLAAMTPAPGSSAFAGESATAVLNVNLTSYRAGSWAEQTCHAEAAYAAGEHPAVSLERLITAASHLGKSYLKADALQLAADASSPAAKATYVSDDEQYVYEDCNNGSGS